MNEQMHMPPSPENEQERLKREYIELAQEVAHGGNFPFPGMKDEVREQIRGFEARNPGFSTPIDELLPRLEAEGVKVVLGTDPESGNVFILPQGSDDIDNDGLFPHYFNLNSESDGRLRRLIELSKDKQAGRF